MKLLFSFICLLMLAKPAPYLEGDYFEMYGGMVGVNWHFTKGGLFTYFEPNCEGGRSGMGHYEIKNDSICFSFLPFPVTAGSKITVASLPKGETDGIWKINLHVVESQTAEMLPFVLVKLSDTLGNVLAAGQTDLDGDLPLSVKDYRGKLKVTTAYIGFSNAETLLATPGGYKLDVALQPAGSPSHIENDKWNYKLEKNEKDKIIFQATHNRGGDAEIIQRELAPAKSNSGINPELIKSIPVVDPKPEAHMPEGYFNNADEYGDGEQFYFGKNNSFTYLWNCSDCGSQGGAGTYSLYKDTLYLRFMPTCKIENLRMLNSNNPQQEQINDSIFYFCAIQTEEPDAFIQAELCDSAGKVFYSAVHKEKSGFYAFGIKATEVNSLYLHVRSFGYNEEWLQLSTLSSPVQITMTKGEYSIPPWIVYKYKVPFIGKNRFELIPAGQNQLPGGISKFFRGPIR